MFSCELWENAKNTFSYRTPPVIASAFIKILLITCSFLLAFLESFSESKLSLVKFLYLHLKVWYSFSFHFRIFLCQLLDLEVIFFRVRFEIFILSFDRTSLSSEERIKGVLSSASLAISKSRFEKQIAYVYIKKKRTQNGFLGNTRNNFFKLTTRYAYFCSFIFLIEIRTWDVQRDLICTVGISFGYNWLMIYAVKCLRMVCQNDSSMNTCIISQHPLFQPQHNQKVNLTIAQQIFNKPFFEISTK